MSTEVGAYYYPLTRDCPIRQKRAKDLGVELVDETLLTQQAEPLFSGHEQPNVYCLGDENVTTWDDSDPAVFAKQIEIAQDYDLDFFVFDTYLGHKNGQFVQEANKPLDQNFLENKFGQNMKFALMLAMSSPRAIIPIPKKSGFEEPGRQYDIGPETAREIVDLCVEKYWNQNNYLTINGSPYLSLFASDFSADSQREADFRTLVNEILTYSHKEYGIDPYLVGVARKISAAKNLVAAGVSALTGYGFLADFGDKTNPIQEYKSLLEKRQQEWLEMKIKSGVPFVPPVVVGWDASPRGEAKLALEEVVGYYPFTPIVVNGGVSSFRIMLERSLDFIEQNVPDEEQYGIICSWNEVTEGAALLPKLTEGKVDFGYLNILKRVLLDRDNLK